ncbi:gamma-glutamyltransferase family protein [Aliiroseovarius sp. PTFE2010]|uniref:gamma-glutamyltransferase family protein n=1 Tax=Aliiroseovarius sp. PTFE2010 TaxID=3417190 RepID=UPI003CF228E9
MFTTRPELSGTFGMVASTHWLASAAGMKALEAGGTAADAAVTAGLVLCVVEPHLNGLLGDMPLLVWPCGDDAPVVLCGQGPAPRRATVEHYRSEGLEMIPGAGLLSTVIPGAFGAWMTLLRDHGRLELAEVMAPAIFYAAKGHPLLANVCNSISANAAMFKSEWPSSADVWLPNGEAPSPGGLFCNPQLADTLQRIVNEAAGAPDRGARIEAARRAVYSGFVAEKIDTYLSKSCVMDGTGVRRKGVLDGQDMAHWQASYEVPVSVEVSGWKIWKPGPWSQGPSLLQALRVLDSAGIENCPQGSPDFVHLVVEALKLAFADREAYYGDPDHSDIPLAQLLSHPYASRRAGLITRGASHDLRSGGVPGFEMQIQAFEKRANAQLPKHTGYGGGEPTMAHLSNAEGDTVHLDVVDQWGNMVCATPSGGWLQSNPVIPGLGAPLNTRAQMFWLDPTIPSGLAPGRRPRTTLSPSMARAPDGRKIAFGTPGGDQQDQWQLIFLLRLMHGDRNMQEAIDLPLFHTGHLQASFYPHGVRLGHLMIEPGFSESTIQDLRERGHSVEVSQPWSVGRLTAVAQGLDGILKAAATPRLMQAYAVGR